MASALALAIVGYLGENDIKASKEDVANISWWYTTYWEVAPLGLTYDIDFFLLWLVGELEEPLSDAQYAAVREVCKAQNYLYTGIASHALLPSLANCLLDSELPLAMDEAY